MEVTVNFVDDEQDTLDTIVSDVESELSYLENKHKIEINLEGHNSAAECLDYLKTAYQAGEPQAAVFADVRMPEMRGDELIEIIAEKYPQIILNILTGFGDLDNTVDHIREKLGLFKYLKKPYDKNTLIRSVDSSLDFFLREKSPVIQEKGVIYKEVETKEELEKAFSITYDVYVNELKRFKLNKLTEEQMAKKQKWDEFDFRSDTRQIIAIKGGEAIARVRIVYNDLPLEKDFEIPPEFINGSKKTEICKLLIKKEHRGTSAYLGLLRFIYHHLDNCEDVYICNLPRLNNFYGKLGFQEMGKFYLNELDDTYSAMHLYLPDVLNHPEEVAKNSKLDMRIKSLVMVPLPKSRLDDFYLQQKVKAIAAVHTIKKYIPLM